jgi:hypothetical protein
MPHRSEPMWFLCWTVCDPKHPVLGFTTPILQRNVMKRQAAQIDGIRASEVMRCPAKPLIIQKI